MKYTKPPVVETVLSVQFRPLSGIGAAHLGAYWKELGSGWPHVADAPAVEPVSERFESATVWDRAAFVKLSSKMDLRLQIRNKEKNRMIQVQNGRFFYNWLGSPGTEYPSYESVRPEFESQWKNFRAFLKASTEEEVRPDHWEIIYVNHIPQATVWNELSDLSKVFTFLSQPQLDNLSLAADGIGGEWRFEIIPQKGRLYLKIGTKTKDERPCVVMTLTARGPVGEGGLTLGEGLDLGHAEITNAFDRLTSPDAQETWGVQDGNR